MASYLASLFGTSAKPVISSAEPSTTPAYQAATSYANALKAKDAATITNLFTANAHIENDDVDTGLIPDECFKGGAAWSEITNKFTLESVMVGGCSDASEACVTMIMRDPADASRYMWSMHLLKVEQIESKYQITGMKVVETLGYGK